VLLAGLQELVCGRKRSRRQSSLFEQALQRAAHQIVIIDYRNECGIPLNGHGGNVAVLPRRRNHALV
jgi:hypothetical protein